MHVLIKAVCKCIAFFHIYSYFIDGVRLHFVCYGGIPTICGDMCLSDYNVLNMTLIIFLELCYCDQRTKILHNILPFLLCPTHLPSRHPAHISNAPAGNHVLISLP